MLKLLQKFLAMAFSLAAITAAGRDWAPHMSDLAPEYREHLLAVLELIESTERGKYVLQRVSPDLEFRTKRMAKWGEANSHDVITLEQLRLESSALPQGSEREIKVKACFTAEILTHELLHNAQFHAGLFNYPAEMSGFEASLCEMLMELEAKYYGEAMFYELSQRPDFKDFVQPKAGLFLVMMRQSAMPDQDFAEALWVNGGAGEPAINLFREQRKEIRNWHSAYAGQAFGNNFQRFLAQTEGVGKAALAERLEKIIAFSQMNVSAEFLIKYAAIEPIPHGVAGVEKGRKKFELEARDGGSYTLRKYYDGAVQEQTFRVQKCKDAKSAAK